MFGLIGFPPIYFAMFVQFCERNSIIVGWSNLDEFDFGLNIQKIYKYL